MDQAAFIRWALDDARTVEERYTTELIVELGVLWWNRDHKNFRGFNLEETSERNRQRSLNPAYDPRYSEEDVRKAAATWPTFKQWMFSPYGLNYRPIRDLKAFAFLTQLEYLSMPGSEVADVGVFAQLPNLKVLHFGSTRCVDLRPLAGCTQLQELALTTGMSFWRGHTQWPDVTGLERLAQLETLSLTGNLLAFAPGLSWPKVRVATLKCEPLAAPDLRRLPQLPACEILTLAGVERLDGIAAFPKLRNLKLETDVQDFTPLTALDRLTCFHCSALEPVDISPLTRLPRLQVATFDARYQFAYSGQRPRDFAVFAESPSLRELHVANCPPVESEVRMVNTLLTPWDEALLAPAPRPLPATLRFIIAPFNTHPNKNIPKLDPEDDGLLDGGLRAAEGNWVARFAEQAISAKLGCTDWGEASGNGTARGLYVEIQAFAVVEKLPAIVAATRTVLAQLRHEYAASICIRLKSPELKATPARLELEQQFRDQQDAEERVIYDQERKELLERQHRHELKKQLGEAIKPADFAPPPRPVPPPEEEEENEFDTDGTGEGDVLVKEKPDPPKLFLEDDHPLADNYRLWACLTLTEFWVNHRQRDIAVYLLGREPDEVRPEEPPPA
jgi:hypothetical protein